MIQATHRVTYRRHQASEPAERTGGRAVECTGLENRRGCKPSVGSNPTLSATLLCFCLTEPKFGWLAGPAHRSSLAEPVQSGSNSTRF